MPGPLEQVLLEMGLDLSPLKSAADAIQSILGKVNDLADQSINKSTQAASVQKTAYREAKDTVDELIKQATLHIAQHEEITARLEAQTAELRKQQLEMRHLGEEAEKTGNFLSKLTGALVGGQSGQIAAAFLGGGIGAGIEAATEGIIKFIERLKEGVLESSKLSSSMDLFEKSARGVGQDPVKFMREMQEATSGLVNKLDLAVLGTRLLTSGIKGLTPEKILEVTKASIELGEANNRSAAQVVSALTRTLTRGGGRNVQMLADVTGIPRSALQLANLAPGLNQAQLSAEGISHAFAVIISQAAQLGESPKTLEQALIRIKVVMQDLTLSFGKGVNESSGMQMVFGLIKDGAQSIEKLEDVAENFGKKFGDVLSGAFVIGQQLLGVVKLLAEDWLVLAKAMMDTFFDPPSEEESVLRQMRELHPVMYEVVKLATIFSMIMERVALSIKGIVGDFKNIVRDSGVGAIIGAVVGGIVAGPMGAVSGANLGAKAAALSRATGLTGWMNQTQQDKQDAQLSKELGFDINHPPGYSVPPLLKRPGTSTWNWENFDEEVAKRMLGLGKALVDPYKKPDGKYKGPPPNEEETNRQREQELKAQEAFALEESALAAERQHTKDSIIMAAADAGMKKRLEMLSEERDATNASYKAGEVELATHLQVLKDIENTSFAERQQNAKTRAVAQVADLLEDRARIQRDADTKVMGVLQDTTGLTQKTKGLQIKTLRDQEVQQLEANQGKITDIRLKYQGELEDLERQHNRTLTDLNEQGDSDILAAKRKAASEQLKVQEEGIRDAEALLKSQYQRLLIPVADYFNAQDKLAVASRDLQIQAAAQIYNSSEKNAQSLQTFRAAVERAYAALTSKRQALDLEVLPETVKARTAEYEVQERLLHQQLDFAQRFPGQAMAGGSNQQLLLLQQRGLYQNQAAGIGSGLAGLQLTDVDLYNRQVTLLQDIHLKLAEVNQELDKMHSITLGMAAIGVSISGFVGGAFQSKFAQNLAGSIQAGSNAVSLFNTPNTGVSDTIRRALKGTTFDNPEGGSYKTHTMKDFVDGIAAAARGLGALADSVLGAKSAISGAFGGSIAGAGLGQAAGTAMSKMGGMFSSLGPYGAAIGAAGGLVAGLITGQKNARVTAQINELQTNFKQIMNQFALNTNNLENTIQELQVLVQQAEAMQSNSKKGSSQFQQVIDQYNQQIMTLKQQQNQVLIKMHEQLAVLTETPGAQNYLNTLQQILEQYSQFEGAAQSAYDLAQANEFLTQSLKDYEQNLTTQLAQDNQQAIQDALQLNDLIFQRSQMMLQYSQQVQGLLSQGVLSRQMTRAQTTGSQIEQLTLSYQRQLDQINEQVSATQYRVAAEQQIFSLAATRIGLETQLLKLQNAQVDLDMQRITALQDLVSQIASGLIDPNSPLGRLISSLPTVTNPAGGSGSLSGLIPGLLSGGLATSLPGTSGLLDLLVSAAYQGRATAGYGSFRGSNI